ncbi:MAG: hypothetical protein QOE27_490 [Solirubrobacteraceae bacterium]|nr:hypothetical protein [Solirubrobacteraceae bacterium]
MTEPPGVKGQQRRMWQLGEYATFAERLQPASDAVVERIGVKEGQTVLDVATGTGNAAIGAAAAGGRVTGLDLTPELFETGRRRAEAGGWEIEWIAGDAESLPFGDGSFDRVVSVFGAMFAPDHHQTARELVRVCRPGGSIGVCAWTPEGSFGRMIRLIMSRTPPPPDFKPPALWGNEGYVTGLFDGLGVELAFERRHVDLEDESAEAWVAYLDRVFGPTILARTALEPRGEWESLRAELVDLYDSLNESRDGRLLVRLEYLMTVATT